MKVLLEIPDNKAAFALEVLKSLAFVKKADPISAEKSELIQDIREAKNNLLKIKKGQVKGRPASELMKELRR